MESWIKQGSNARKQGDLDGAIAYFRKAVHSKNRKVRIEGRRLLADVYYLKGDTKKAHYFCNQLLKENPPLEVRAPLTHLKAILFEDKGNLKKAEGLYRNAINLFEKINRDSFEMTRVHLGLNLFFQGERERGIQFLTRGIYGKRKGSRLAKFIAFLNLARIRALQGRYLEAKCILERGRHYIPDASFYHAWFLAAEAFLKEQEGDKKEAVRIFETVYDDFGITKLPFVTGIIHSLIRLYLEQGAIIKAKKMFHRTRRQLADTKDYYSQAVDCETGGLIDFCYHRYKRSLEIFRKVRRKYAKAPYPFEETKALFYQSLMLFYLNRRPQCFRLLKQGMRKLALLRYWTLFNDDNLSPLFRLAHEKGILLETKPEADFRCTLFGNFLMKIGDREITAQDFKNKQALKVLYILFLNPNKPICVDTFYEFVWRKKSIQTAKRGLYEAVSYCRRLCVPFGEFIRRRGDAYQFTASERIFIDTMELEKKFQAGQVLENLGKIDDALNHYCKAIDLYKEDLIAEFLYERFAEEYRAYFKSLIMKIFNKAVTLASKLKKRRLLRELLERAFAIDETDEAIAKNYVHLCLSSEENKKAIEIFRHHKTQMWRRFKLRPCFSI